MKTNVRTYWFCNWAFCQKKEKDKERLSLLSEFKLNIYFKLQAAMFDCPRIFQTPLFDIDFPCLNKTNPTW